MKRIAKWVRRQIIKAQLFWIDEKIDEARHRVWCNSEGHGRSITSPVAHHSALEEVLRLNARRSQLTELYIQNL